MQWFEIAKFHLKQIIIKSISKLHKHLHLLKIINEIIKLKNATSTSIKKKKISKIITSLTQPLNSYD